MGIPQLSTSSSRDNDGRMHLTLCNVAPHDAGDLYVVHGAPVSIMPVGSLTGDDMQAHNTSAHPDRVTPARFE